MEVSQNKSKVFFSKIISPEKLVELSILLSQDINKGKFGIKINIGNKKDKNINPEFFRPLVDYFQGNVIDCNSLYISSEKNIKEFSKYFELELLDKNNEDEEIEIINGKILKKTYIGHNLKKFDSFIIISNFSKSNGLGIGSISELSLGLSSKKGKTLQITGGKSDDFSEIKNKKCEFKIFKEASAEVAYTNYDYIKRNAIFINLLGNINSESPNDIGILASIDPVAIDQASIDLITNSENKEMIKKIGELEEKYLIDCSYKLGIGNKEYEIISIN